ncbi:MAG TPA: patatin-like phospholipase family protein [Nitrososphaeraceae archaeon]|nr:patatin-like phospholipase family protein [Nitrososphaeraceae archaeon]
MKSTNDFQRTLVFQGGGSLGAYEAGAYKAFYELASERDKNIGRNDKPLFDIVAGTSIGAMNASVLVSYVKEKKTWRGSAERLIEFWEHLATESVVDKVPGFTQWWDYSHYLNNVVATSESARRYYNTKQFIFYGVPNVFKPSQTIRDKTFLDPSNVWYLYSNEPLKQSLEKFAKFPIATSYEKKEPRLLLVAVDVQEGSTVVFDSYEKADGSRKTEYGRYGQEFAHNGNEGFEHVIRYNNGIEVEFVLASGSVPVNYDYTKLMVENHGKKDKTKSENEDKKKSHSRKTVNKKERYFWDGGIIANTPLREAVLEHRRYWHFVRKSEVPLLRAFIINVHPIKQEYLPTNYDGVVDRKNDLTYHDRTLFDEKMVVMITDYVSIIKSLIKLAKDNKIRKNLVDNILQQQALSRNFMTGKHGTYADLIENMVSVDLVVRVERKNDIHTISNKTFDFSSATIQQLIKDGYEEAMDQGTKILRQRDLERHNKISK